MRGKRVTYIGDPDALERIYLRLRRVSGLTSLSPTTPPLDTLGLVRMKIILRFRRAAGDGCMISAIFELKMRGNIHPQLEHLP